MDKMAVRDGGGKNHRVGLYDMVMVKDNHVTAAGGVAQAVRAVQRGCEETGQRVGVEVETRTLDEVRELLTFMREEVEAEGKGGGGGGEGEEGGEGAGDASDAGQHGEGEEGEGWAVGGGGRVDAEGGGGAAAGG